MDNIDLAKRARACKHWRWMTGMHNYIPFEFLGTERDMLMPDLSKPQTLGWLLHLVREAWGEPGANASRDACGSWYVEWWSMETGTRRVIAFGHATEAEALVAALEAAP